MPTKNNAFRPRFDFSKIPTTIQIPNLIEVQKRSYDRFLQMDRLPSERDDTGLQAVFQSVLTAPVQVWAVARVTPTNPSAPATAQQSRGTQFRETNRRPSQPPIATPTRISADGSGTGE